MSERAPGGVIADVRSDAGSEPIWFGPSARPLAGRLHRPIGDRARGGIVLCPPIGLELSHSQDVIHQLADGLCTAGFVVLRFDYDGTGQSNGGMDDPHRLDGWRASVDAALELVRGLGLGWLAGIGLRLGATLLAEVAEGRDDLDALVLWDPCLSGRSFLRESVALRRAACPQSEPEVEPPGTEILGYELGAELVEELGALELPHLEPRAGRRVMALVDPARAANGRLAPRLPEPVVEWHTYAAPEQVFDIGEIAHAAPTRVVAQLVDWVAGACVAAPAVVADSPAVGWAAEAVVGHGPGGVEIVERTVSLGEHRLAGIECAPRAGSVGPVVLFVSLAAESSIGPVRQWVELARRWAADGVRSVRFDLSGVGESPTRSDLRRRAVYAHEHVREILEAAAAVSPDDPTNVVLVGVCSGAFHALVAGPRLRPRGVVAANPILTYAMPDRPGAAPTDGPPAIPVATGALPPAGRLGRLRRTLRAHLPWPAWAVLHALGVARSPAVRLRPLVRERVSTLLMLGPTEAEVPLRRAPRVLARLAATGASRVEIVPGLDHSLRDRHSRDLFAESATAFVATLVGRVGDGEGAAADRASRPVERIAA